ncbi:MAG: YraN family protein [Proteobacteria bacterium]|nr:YraN family protein [Pseudomonadota bacterium]
MRFKIRKAPHLRTGSRGELAAAWWLRLKGYRILQRNFSCRGGEIDIIAGKKDLIIFVEVRTRTRGALVNALQTVDPVKVSRTIRAAATYLKFYGKKARACRFDVIAIDAGRWFPISRMLHLKGAFDATSGEYEEGRRMEASRRRRSFSPGKGGKKGSPARRNS